MNSNDSCIFRLTSLLLPTLLAAGMSCSLAADISTPPSQADLTELSLEDLMKVVVVSASKFPQSSSQAPSAVQVLTAEDIRWYGWNTLAEALGSLPGLYASSDRAYGFLGARGFKVPGDYNMRFLLLLDGQPLNDNLYGQATLGYEFQVDMSLVDRIEYVPGPGSSIYGSNAMFGVVNVITRSAASLPGISAGLRVLGDGLREVKLSGAHRGAGNGPDLVYSLSRSNKSGRDLRYPDGIGKATADGSPSAEGWTHNLDQMMVTRAYGGLKQDGLSLSAWAARRDVQPSSALFGSNFDDARLRLIDSSYGFAGSYQRAISETLDLNLRLAYQKITYQGSTPYFDADFGSFVSRDEAFGSWLSGEARFLYAGIRDHKLIAGLDFQSDLNAVLKYSIPDVSLSEAFVLNSPQRRYGVYLQDEWHFADDWRLNVGLRSDSYSTGRSNFSPRLGLIWNATEKTTLKLLAGQAYRAPNMYESEYSRQPNFLPNPNLQPETIRTVEAVAEYRLDANQEIGASVFDYQLTDLIRQIDTGNLRLQFQNQAPVYANGLETYYKLRSKNGLNLMASLAFNQSHDAAGQTLSNSPRWLAKLRFYQPLLQDQLVVALEANAIGPRSAEWRGISREIERQSQLNLSLTATRLAPGLELQLRIVNLFNSYIFHPASNEASVATWPMDGRRWQLGLNYGF